MKDYSYIRTGTCFVTNKQPAGTVLYTEQRNKESGSLSNTSVSGSKKDPHPQSLTRREMQYQSGSVHIGFENSPYYTDYEGPFGTTSDPTGQSLAYSSIAYNKALEKLYTKLRGELDLSIDLIEARQVRTMLSQGLSGLRDMVGVVRRMRRSPADTAANLWLQWTYGWKPLASSIYGVTELFKNGAKTGLICIKTFANDTDRRELSWNSTGDGNVLSRTNEAVSKRCMFQCEFGVNDSVLNNLASLSSLNPVSITWELVPYSFVFDWFIDIGGYLNNLESALLYRSAFKRGFYTEGYKFEGTTVTAGTYRGSGQDRSYNLRGSYRLTGKRRSVLSSSPLPRAPSFRVDLGASRLLSAASLLQQTLARR